MSDIRVTIRLSLQDVQMIDMFLKSGECCTRSEFIRRAVKEYSKNHVEEIVEEAETMQKLQKLINIYEANSEYMKK